MQNVAVFWGLGVSAHWTEVLSKYATNFNFYNFNLYDIDLIHDEKKSKVKDLFFKCDYIILHSLASYLLKKNYSKLFKKVIAFDPNSMIKQKEPSFIIAKWSKNKNTNAINKMINQLSLACNGANNWKEYAVQLDPKKLGHICIEITDEFYLNKIITNLLKKNVLVFKSKNFSISEKIKTQLAPQGFSHLPMIEHPKEFSIFLESILHDK